MDMFGLIHPGPYLGRIHAYLNTAYQHVRPIKEPSYPKT